MSKIFRGNDKCKTIIDVTDLLMFSKADGLFIELHFQMLNGSIGCLVYSDKETRDRDYDQLALLIDLKEG